MNTINKYYSPAVTVLLLMAVFAACKKENIESEEQQILDTYLTLPNEPYNYANPKLPGFFNNQFVTIQNNTPGDNPVTQWGATLGRVLFYDVRLSVNNTISCSSCHIQEFGFTDTAQFSIGFEGGRTKRHSMALINAAYYSNGRFFWDERASTLEEQVLMPVQDAVEMGMKLDDLENKLKTIPIYPILFKRAFGTSDINKANIARALAQFVRSLISYQSKYDEGRVLVSDRNTDFPNFTTQENWGKTIFMNNHLNCFGCHNTDVFITDNPRNNGVHTNNEDVGVFIHTNNARDLGSFKAPSLKNVALRGRFMDDGSFTSLQDVMEHYNNGIKPNPNLDSHLKDSAGNPLKMNLTQIEIDAVKAFLKTLTDDKIINDPKFSSPFK